MRLKTRFGSMQWLEQGERGRETGTGLELGESGLAFAQVAGNGAQDDDHEAGGCDQPQKAQS
jgi:hypothetical protein